ncbi:MAG: hypothetical protein FRX49_03515 [Trebouxia sp. A1-2]|nr:MAG: hypothetical protein FRX49_03515 [Trebouxia sp. A1-2]
MLARRLNSAAKPAILSGSAASVSLLPSSLCRQQKRCHRGRRRVCKGTSRERPAWRRMTAQLLSSPTTQLVKVHLWGEQQMQGPVYMVLQEDIIPFVILGHMQQLPLVTRCLHEKKQGSKTAKQIILFRADCWKGMLPQSLGKADGIALRQQVMALQRPCGSLEHPHSLAHKQNALCYADRDMGRQGLH